MAISSFELKLRESWARSSSTEQEAYRYAGGWPQRLILHEGLQCAMDGTLSPRVVLHILGRKDASGAGSV